MRGTLRRLECPECGHELDRMLLRNPEWDFISRTYFVLALANTSKGTPASAMRLEQPSHGRATPPLCGDG